MHPKSSRLKPLLQEHWKPSHTSVTRALPPCGRLPARRSGDRRRFVLAVVGAQLFAQVGDALAPQGVARLVAHHAVQQLGHAAGDRLHRFPVVEGVDRRRQRSEEHTSELQSLMSISYAVLCYNIKNIK